MRWEQRYINFLLDGSEYYDFELTNERSVMYGNYPYIDDLIIDINVCSGFTSSVRWVDAITSTFDLDFITTTGLDNYFVDIAGAYDDGVIDQTIVASFTDDEYFTLYPVSGWSTNVSYEIVQTDKCSAKLNGGFYQGFFKLAGYPYEMAPTRMRKGWTVDMIVEYPSIKTGTGTTLNDLFPDNAGFIFYMGTRGEDKFWNGFTTGTTGEESAFSNWTGLTITDERYAQYYYPTDVPASNTLDTFYYRPDETSEISDYLYYHTSNRGYGITPTINDSPSLDPLNPSVNDENVFGGFKIGYVYGGGTSMSASIVEYYQGYSPLFTHGGDFVTSGDTTYIGYYHYDDHVPYAGRVYGDQSIPLYVKYPWRNITDNAFGIRIRPDGHIGYRVLRMGSICQTGTTVTVEDGVTGTTTSTYTVEESYSSAPIWTAENNGNVNISIVYERYIELNGCEIFFNDYRKGTLTIYVNARPVFVQKNFEEIIPHSLDRQKELQSGIPFNISWGGGTQGLLESVTFGGIDAPDRNLLLQTLFAGTWMGTLHEFKMYIKPLYVPQIIHNFELRKAQYNMLGDFGGRYIFITKG